MPSSLLQPTPVSLVSVAPAPLVLPSATEAGILADAPSGVAAYRFAADPAIVVLQFPSLAAQGRALNRVAALVEKQGFPRDRLLDDQELDSRIRAGGATPETFYLGHDYPASALARFYAMADRDRIALAPEEKDLRALLVRLGWLADPARQGGEPGSEPPRAALITLARAGHEAELDPSGRAAILRHELSHGAYFTDPAYAAFAHHFWNAALSQRERDAFRRFLSDSGYDPADGELMVNEMQAYLMHTPDPRFFNATAVGMTEARLDLLRGQFLTGMPPGWLRDCTGLPAGAPAGTPRSPGPARVPRRRRYSRVRRTKAVAATSPRRCAASATASRSRAK